MIVLALLASAQEPLWRNIEPGMTREAVVALYPQSQQKRDRTVLRDQIIVGDCPANVDIFYDGERVTRVEVLGKQSFGVRCSFAVRDALGGLYGPFDEFANGEWLDRKWQRPGMTITYRNGGYGFSNASWTVVYRSLGSADL